VPDHSEAVLVTTAGRSPKDERRDRERRYLITMAIRVVAIIVAIVLARGWVRVVAIALSLVLPWIAVIVANAGPTRSPREAPTLYSKRPPRELTDR
jgi:xanthine/uracil permease